MSPKRRYQFSSFGIGLPPPPLPPPEYFSNLTYSYDKAITSAEIAVNPCLSSKKIQTGTFPVASTPPPSKGKKVQKQECVGVEEVGINSGKKVVTKGSRTYRVKHHHQNHYDLPIVRECTPATPTGKEHKGGSRPSSSSLSQGIFGLPVMQDYFYESRGKCQQEETLEDQHPPLQWTPKPRSRMTLPSCKTPCHLVNNYPQQDHMDGVLQVRPASRSRTRPEHSVGGGPQKRQSGPRRRVQSTSGFYKAVSAETLADLSSSQMTFHIAPDLLESCLSKLKSQDFEWEEIVDGFHFIQKVTTESPSEIRPILRKIIWLGLPHLSSSRTKLSRAACQCFKVLFETQRRSMESSEGTKVFQRLLDLSGVPSNKFIQEECKVALIAAVQHTDPLKSLSMLEQFGARHKNGNVREVAALLLSKLMGIVSAEKLMSKEFAIKIFPMIVGFLKEGQLSTRLSGKQCLEKIFFHPDFQICLRRYVAPQNIRHVQDTLKKFQKQYHRAIPK